ncbi:MAG: GNAT family N-acetyltransferase [Alphaproteobacteria bacterium]|nr:GNAT family N-acetyltransferase [Alphaproteobacteria bacterium]
MDVLIKQVGKADAHLFRQVAEDVFDHEVDPERLARYLDEPNHLMCVAVHDGLVVGQVRAVVHKHPDRAAELYIDNAGVAPAFQRNGIATRLVAEIVRRGRARGCEDVWVGTEPDNEAAVAFYRSLGWEAQPMVSLEAKLSA